MLVGLVNGLITVRLGLTSFITTLGTHYLSFGIAMALAEGKEIIGLPAVLSTWGNAPILGVSPGFLIFVVLVLVGDLVLKRTTLGGMVIATGGNRLAARVAGINTDRVKIACFVLVSTLAAVAGLLTMARFQAGDVYIGRPWQLTVIAISVLGGVSLLGGVGTILGAFFGAFLVQAIRSSLVMLGVQATGQDLVIGVFLVIAATADVLRRRTRT
jgi:ribose/xylose/arabinose/galactoside ABC-type transport system permease subunit